MRTINIGLIGNPNCGKTTLFNALTGARQRVGNWPGVTVDRKTGFYQFDNREVRVNDTPGIYSLSASSLDERITREFILAQEASLLVNIVDASNIERNLYLTSQLLEMEVPLVIALNMMDIAADKRLKIDAAGLAKRLGCPVVPIVAAKGVGVEELKRIIANGTIAPPATAEIEYPVSVREARIELGAIIKDLCSSPKIHPQWLALKLLEGDEQAREKVTNDLLDRVSGLQAEIGRVEGEDPDILIASARYSYISKLTSQVVQRQGQAGAGLSEKIDRVVLNRMFGIPIFLAAMYLMFMFTINFGGAFIDFFDKLTGAIFVNGFSAVLQTAGAPAWLTTVLADGIGGGIQTMATFIPPIGFMFLCLSFLEDSGYMARAAFVMDRFMRFIGLPGKAFVPMLVGFGCNVPAIMATRTLDNERDRTLTVMMNPFMSCGARLPVYALFAAAFFPTGGQNLVFLLYLIGICFAVLTGMVLKNTLLRGEASPFIMEMPPYHLPTFRSVVLRAYERLTSFLFKAGRVLIPVIMVLSFLNSLGTDGSFGNRNSESSALATISKTITPVLAPLGVTADNWPATVGIFTGIFAKEAVVGTLDALYTGLDQKAAGKSDDKEPFDLIAAIGEAFATIPENLAGLADKLGDPLGLSIVDISDTDAAAEAQKVNTATFGSMVLLFGSQSAAFAYLLFILLYFPCSAAISAVYRETNLAWTIFAGFWTTFLAFIASTLFYQITTFAEHPGYSALVIGGDLAAFILVLVVLKSIAGAGKRMAALVTLRQQAGAAGIR